MPFTIGESFARTYLGVSANRIAHGHNAIKAGHIIKGEKMTKTITRKPARSVTETALPTNDKGNLDLSALLMEALTVPGKMSNAYSRFHRYSFMNMLIVYMQTGKMEPMGTFKKWQSLNRSVVKGNKALFVNHPKFAPDIDPATGKQRLDDKGKGKMKMVGAVPKATVFQLSQTDGPELVLPELPDWSASEAMAHLNIVEVPFAIADGNTQGYSYVEDEQRKFALNPVAVAPLKTMIHEFAHLVLGHCDAEHTEHRGVKEFQAEAVALLVCKELDVEGFDAGASRAYIQGWLGMRTSDYMFHDDEIGDAVLDVNDKVIRQIFSATDAILVAGRAKHFSTLD